MRLEAAAAKAAKRQKRIARINKADEALHATGIRTLRRKPVFTTPNYFPPHPPGQHDPRLGHARHLLRGAAGVHTAPCVEQLLARGVTPPARCGYGVPSGAATARRQPPKRRSSGCSTSVSRSPSTSIPTTPASATPAST